MTRSFIDMYFSGVTQWAKDPVLDLETNCGLDTWIQDSGTSIPGRPGVPPGSNTKGDASVALLLYGLPLLCLLA